MTNSNHHHNEDPLHVDDVFADLVSSMPDLASLGPDAIRPGVEIVEIAVPAPNGSGESARITFEVPSVIAPLLRAEFSPERIAAMTQAITAMATLAISPHDLPPHEAQS